MASPNSPDRPFIVVARTAEIAREYIEAFGLNKRLWHAAGLFEAKTGRRYERVVVVASSLEHVPGQIQDLAGRWRVSTPPNGQFHLL